MHDEQGIREARPLEVSLEAMLIEHQVVTKCLKGVERCAGAPVESDSYLSDSSHALIHLIHFYYFQWDTRSVQPVSQEWQPLAVAAIDVMKLLHDLRLVEVVLSGRYSREKIKTDQMLQVASGGLSETAPSDFTKGEVVVFDAAGEYVQSVGGLASVARVEAFRDGEALYVVKGASTKCFGPLENQTMV